MRIGTWNINGIRAASRKGFDAHLERVAPDLMMLQEVRATPDKVPPPWQQPVGWHTVWHPAEKPGYAGTAMLSRHEVKVEAKGAGEPDTEGRVVMARVAGVRFASVYLPSGSSGEHRQAEKDRWLKLFIRWSEALAKSRIPTILGGDFNIAHTERDIYYAKANEKNSGFLPHERAWFTDLLDQGWVDIVRDKYGSVQGPYSWWSNRGQARALDRGWRIDYLLANRSATKLVTDCHIDRASGLEVSDHAMVVADLDVQA
ncbi:MAG: exodeoxyribonuclease III [Planctomycetota bacterium]|nr:MAG: exodeoxyribonuclease III [Planctomycetota bacterium]